jgi:hypothetical protein
MAEKCIRDECPSASLHAILRGEVPRRKWDKSYRMQGFHVPHAETLMA